MQVVNIKEAKNNFKAIFDSVYLDNDEYNSMKETNYLLNNPNNAKHLQESIKQIREGH